uniref:uncharacterized protein LOC120331046 n=1 Tax=Styela clava TaxID=7725 RepID=UPI0019397EA3|nr:uncharacterized protein LOC120331046 [Styela clava]
MDRKEDTGASASTSSSESADRSSVDLQVRNQELLVAGSAVLFQAEKNMKADIASSNVNMIAAEAAIVKGRVAIANFYGNVNINIDHTDAAPSHPSTPSVPTGTPVQPLPETGPAIAPVYKGNPPGFFQQVTKKLFGGVRSFIDYFNWRTWKQTTVNVTESYKDQNLEEPEFEVNPKLNKVTGFYRGQMAPDVTEYRKEKEFAVTQANENIGEVISPNELVQQLCGEGCRCVGLVGQAGGGKSTMMKRTARGVLVANELDNESKAKMGLFARLFRKQKNGFKFVHHLNFRDLLVSYGLTPEEALTPCTLLFGNFAPNLSDQTVRAGYEWLQLHQSEAILFIDGLDQAIWNLEGNYNKMTYTDRSSTATIMFNILSGNLFPDVTLVISSREHRMASLPLKLRPPLIIALAGLERDDTKKLFTAVVGETGEESWKKMTFQSPALVPLSSVPLFLIFNAIVHKSNPENLPNTMTDVMTKVLHIFMRSSHTQEKKSIEIILHNLMKMSFEATREKRVIFNNTDLKNAGLTKEMVRDLIIEIPGGSSLLNQHLLEGDTLMFFSHQILQEMLAALYIANMDLATFQAFVTSEILKDHWSVVLRLLCGTVFDQKIKAQFIKDLTTETGLEKQNCLKHALTTKINQCTKSYQKLELFGALYEANDAELIRSHVQEINFENESFTAAGMCAMSCVMRRCGHLEQVRLVNCELNAELMKNFEFNLKGSIVKVSEFDISLNPMSVEAFDIFGSVLTNIEVEKLVMRGCSLTEEKFRVLGRHSHLQIRVLDVGNITNMTFDLYLAIVKFASEHDVKELLMDPWDFFKASEEQMLELSKWKVCGKINVLDVQSISRMPSDLCLTISEFASQSGVKKILMDSLDFSKANKEQIKKLCEYKSCGKISTIDISQNPMDEEAFDALGDLLSNYEVDQLIAKNCQLTKAKLDALGSHSGLKLSRFDISENPMDEKGFNALGSALTTNIKVLDLVLQNCQLTKKKLDVLGSHFGLQIAKLDVSHNFINEEAFNALGSLSNSVGVDELIMQNCQLTKTKLDAFGSHSRLKLSRININENPMDEKGFNALGSLLTTNNKVLHLVMQNCELTKEKLDALGSHSELKICSLDIRSITGMTFNLFLAISKFASENEVKELLMDPWKEFKATKDQILELSKWKVGGKIFIIDISRNPMDEEAFDALGDLLSNYEVDQLIAKNCQLTKAKLDALGSHFGLKLSRFDISENPMDKKSFNALGSALTTNIKVLELVMQNCRLNKEKLDALGSHSGLQLSKFDISENPMDEKGFNALGSLLIANNEVIDLVIQNCQLTKEKLDALGSHSGLKINVLDVQSISRMPSDVCLTIFEFASRSGVKKILMDSLHFSKANKEQLKKLSKYKFCGKISVIDISQNSMDEEAFDALGDLLSKYEVDQLIAKNCQLTKAKLDALGGHSGLKICTLDIRSITGMTFNLFLAISKFATESEVKELLMDPWKEFKATKDQILELSKWKVCGKISIIDISQNPMDEEACDALSDLLSNYEVDQLIAKNCQLTKAKLDALGSHSGLKLSRFDISGNPMDEKGFNALGSLLTANNRALDLVMQNCQLTKEKLDALGSHSGLKLSRINISENSMDEKGFNALGSLLTTNNKVLHLVMQNCQLTKEKLDALGSRSVLKICTLDIRSITGMTFDLFLAISKFACESEAKELLMDPWKEFKATKDQIMELSKWKVCGKLDVLKVSNNTDLGTAGFGEVGLVVSQCQVNELDASYCNLTAEGMKAFKGNTLNAKLDILDISDNYNLGTAGFGEVGLVVSNCEVKELQARNCNLTAKEIRAFKENTGNAELEILDISLNDNLGTAGFGEVGLVVSECQVKEFKAWDCNLTAEEMKAFKENTSNAKLDILDVGWNKNLGTSGFGEVGLVVSKCQVNEFRAPRCNLTAEGMKVFKENTRNAKIDSLDLSLNKVSKLGDEGLSAISEIVHRCRVENLYMWFCYFNEDQLERFKALIADTGVKFLR